MNHNIDKKIENDRDDLRDLLSPLDELVNEIHADTFPDIDKIAEEAGKVISFEKSHDDKKRKPLPPALRRFIACAAALLLFVTSVFVVPQMIKREKPIEIKNISIENVSNEKSDPNDYSLVFDKIKAFNKRTVATLEGGRNSFFDNFFKNDSEDKAAMRPEAGKAQTTDEFLNSDSAKDDYSKTNQQVEGVSEADIFKTDGKNLYYLRRNNKGESVLEIVEAGKDGALTTKFSHNINSFSQDSTFSHIDMYLTDDKLIIIGGVAGKANYSQRALIDDVCYYGGSGFDTEVLFFDISEVSNTKRLSKFKQEGAVISSRMVDGVLYIVSSLQKENANDINKNNVKDYIPNVTGQDGVVKAIAADRIYALPDINSISYTTLSAIDTKAIDKPNTISVLGGGNEIYSNTESLYVAGNKYTNNSTDLLRFSINKAAIKLEAAGNVNGSILNQFAMDEYQDHFRIATNDMTGNNIYVLNKSLKLVGKIEKLAKGEQLKSVRFMGDMGYIVTFLQVDPLFAIDLSNPAKPEVKSELKIPGFSSYMHPIDDNTLVGIGTDGSDAGMTFGVKFSMFDVTDSKKMVERFKITIGGSGAYSPAMYNHKAITYIEKSGLFIIPVFESKNNYDKNEKSAEFFWGFYVVSFNKESGFKVVAKIPNSDLTGSSKNDYYTNNVDNYRSAYIGTTLFAITNDGIISVSMESFTRIDMLKFENTSKIDGDYRN